MVLCGLCCLDFFKSASIHEQSTRQYRCYSLQSSRSQIHLLSDLTHPSNTICDYCSDWISFPDIQTMLSATEAKNVYRYVWNKRLDAWLRNWPLLRSTKRKTAWILDQRGIRVQWQVVNPSANTRDIYWAQLNKRKFHHQISTQALRSPQLRYFIQPFLRREILVCAGCLPR